MGRWLAGRLMKELGLVSCQQPTHRYKRGGHEHVAIPNYLERQFRQLLWRYQNQTEYEPARKLLG